MKAQVAKRAVDIHQPGYVQIELFRFTEEDLCTIFGGQPRYPGFAALSSPACVRILEVYKVCDDTWRHTMWRQIIESDLSFKLFVEPPPSGCGCQAWQDHVADPSVFDASRGDRAWRDRRCDPARVPGRSGGGVVSPGETEGSHGFCSFQMMDSQGL